MSDDGEARRAGEAAGFNPYAEPEAIGEVAPTAEDEAAAAAGEIEVAFRNTDEDVAAFLQHQVARPGRLGPTVRVAIPSLLTWAALNAVFLASGRYGVGLGIFMVAWLAVMLAIGPWLLRWQVRRLARRQAGKSRSRPEMTVAISPEGIVTRVRGQAGATARDSWPAITAIEVTKDHIFLKESKSGGEFVTARVIPRSAFATPEAAEVFLRAARRWKAEAAPVPTTGAEGARDPEVISITFTLSHDDRRRMRALRRKAARRQRWAVLGLVGLPLAGTVYCGAQVAWLLRLPAPFRWPRLPIYVALLVPSAYLLVIGLRLAWVVLFRFGRVRDEGPTTIEIAPEGYVVRKGRGQEEARAWEATPLVGGDERFLKLGSDVIDRRRGVVLMHLIPRSAFATPEQAESFRARAERWHAAALARLRADPPEAAS